MTWLKLNPLAARQSTTGHGGVARRGADGKTNGNWGSNSVTHTNGGLSWWRIDLQQAYDIREVRVWGRTDCCEDRSKYAVVRVTNMDRPGTGAKLDRSSGTEWGARTSSTPVICTVPGGKFLVGA